MRGVGVVIVLAIIALGVLWLIPVKGLDQPKLSSPNYPVETVRKNIRDVTPENALPGPKIIAEQVTRLPDVVPVPPREKVFEQSKLLRKITVVAAGVLKHGKTTIAIASVKPLKLNETCRTIDNQTWMCGRFARTALRLLIRGRPIKCIKEISGEIPIVTACTVANRDIGKWLVQQGWAKPTGIVFIKEMKLAREERRGMWRTDPR